MFNLLIFYISTFLFYQTPPSPPQPIPIRSLVLKPLPSQTATSGQITVPEYYPVKLKTSSTSKNIEWTILSYNNSKAIVLGPNQFFVFGPEVVFSGPPGNYIAISKDENSAITTTVTISGNPAPNPNPPTPVPDPPTPTPPDPNDPFIYPPDYVAIKDSVFKALSTLPDKAKVANDARALALLYEFCAAKIELDGTRPDPGLKTVSQVSLLIKSEETNLLAANPVKPASPNSILKEKYPDVSKIVVENFTKTVGSLKTGDILTPEARKTYVYFLRALSAGFSKVVE